MSARHRVAGKVVTEQPLGGIDDERGVIEPVYRAAELAEDLYDDRHEGALLSGRFAFSVRYKWFRNWVNSSAGHRLGLAAIPEGQINLRRLRRTLALEMAYQPGGMLATKIHLKHIAVATTEEYASRPDGAQAELLAEVTKHESDRNLDLVLVLQGFRNYRQGILPAGPGARGLTEFSASVDGKLDPEAATGPKTQRSDRDELRHVDEVAVVGTGSNDISSAADVRGIPITLSPTDHSARRVVFRDERTDFAPTPGGPWAHGPCART